MTHRPSGRPRCSRALHTAGTPSTRSPSGKGRESISGTLTTTDTSNPFDLVRRISYLTDDAEEAQGH